MTRRNSLPVCFSLRSLCLFLSLTLIVSLCTPIYLRTLAQEIRHRQQARITPAPGKPLGQNLPNLSSIRYLNAIQPHAPAPASTYRPCFDCGERRALSDALSSARLEPRNRTGQPDVDLLSQNFRWDKTLINLKGRAGLDLRLALILNCTLD